MSMYDKFETDASLETKGVWINFGEFRVCCARAGGANRDFMALTDKRLRRFRKPAEYDAVGVANSKEFQSEVAAVYAITVIRDWEVLVTDKKTGEQKWQRGIEARDGSILPFNVSNVTDALIALPGLFDQIREETGSHEIYRASVLEEESKN